MEKLKKFVKKNQVLLIAVCVCIAALTATFFAGGNLSDSKVQTASTLKAPPILQNRTKTTKIKRTKKTIKIPKTKRTARSVRRTAAVLLLKKVKKPSRFQATVLRIRKSRLLHQTVLQNQTKRMMFSRRHRISTKPIPCRRENQSRLSRRSRKQRIQTFIVPLQSPVQQFSTIWMPLIPKKLNSFQRTV